MNLTHPLKEKMFSDQRPKQNLILFCMQKAKFERVEIKVGVERSISAKVELMKKPLYNKCPL